MNSKKNLGLRPKKTSSLTINQKRYLSMAAVGATGLFSACGGGGGGGAPGFSNTGSSAPVLAFVPDATVKEGESFTLNPTATSPSGRSLTFSYSGFMTGPTKQTVIGDKGIYNVQVTVSDGQLTTSINVRVIVYSGAPTRAALHLARRITYGMTPSLYYELDVLGVQGFIDQQLDPQNIDDSQLSGRTANISMNNRTNLKRWTLLNMVYSKRQLVEVMTEFWDNHFSTDINTVRGNRAINDAQEQLERDGNDAFRANALGNFRQLLGSSAKSPTMLLYLNGAQNRKSDSNENYARELLELHTMGVDGGYDHFDIEAGAEIFTGWHLEGTQFFFNAAEHNNAAQAYLGQTIPSGGVIQGEQALDILANHLSTAKFICKKLITLFVTDRSPPVPIDPNDSLQQLIDRCAVIFQNAVNAPDQITQVLREILSAAEFTSTTNYHSKIKTPLELAVSIVRGVDGETNAERLHQLVQNMGFNLYEQPDPTGWSEKGIDWMSSGLLTERLKVVEYLLRVNSDRYQTTNMVSFCARNGATTSDAIVDFMLTRLLGEYPAATRTQALAFLGATFSLTERNAETRLRQLAIIVMAYPQFQYQ